jgi:Cu(I)/Ag(I) efflux system membrane fusion protein
MNQEQKGNPVMNGMNTQQDDVLKTGFTSPGTQIREGMYVNEGQTLFELNDLEKVWAVVSLPVSLLSQVVPGQQVTIFQESDSSQKFSGKVLLTEQAFNESGQRFARVRIELSNPGNTLKAYSFITARFSFDRNLSQQVPASAVYKTGLQAFVWVKTGSTAAGAGIFELRKVTAGPTVNGMTSITEGITAEDEIAMQAGLLTDSEFFLNAY